MKTRLLLLAELICSSAVLIACGGGSGGGGSTTGSGLTFHGNSIVYGVPSSDGTTFSLNEVKPDGTSNTQLVATLPTSILLFAQIPNRSNSFVTVNDNGQGAFGINLSTGLGGAQTSTLVPAVYSYVSSLSVSADGLKMVYSAILASDPSQTGYLFTVPLTGGNPVQLDFSDGSTLSPADGDTIAYVASPGGTANFDQVFTRSLKAGAKGQVNQLTSNMVNHSLPAINRAGTTIAWWESAAASTLWVKSLTSSSAAVSLPNPNQVSPQGESFSPDGSQLAIAADANGVGELLVQRLSGSNPVTILMNTQLMGNYGVYWTDANGRFRVSSNSLMPSVARRRRGLDLFLHVR